MGIENHGEGARPAQRQSQSGYFHPTSRGWFAKAGSTIVSSTSPDGVRLKDKITADDEVREAYARYLLTKPAENLVPDSATVLEVCLAYLAKSQ